MIKNRRSNGKLFAASVIDEVWSRAEVVVGYDENEFRKDICGALIKKDLFGQKNSKLAMAWEIAHIKPIEIGGEDSIYNLLALQWENNLHKKDNYPFWTCKVKEHNGENCYI